MTSPVQSSAPLTATPPVARSASSTLRRVTRLLAGVHLLGGVGLIVVAVVLLLDYRSAGEDEILTGLTLVVGILFAAMGVVLLVLAGLAVGVSREIAANALGLATGLVSMLFTGAGSIYATGGVPLAGTLVGLLSIALVTCSAAGLAGTRRG